MIPGRTEDDYNPLTWVGRVPVYACMVIAGIHGITMLFTTLLYATQSSWLAVFPFYTSEVLDHFQLWRVLTYAFVNPESPGFGGYFWFAVQIYLLVVFGREVERFIGRKAFLGLYTVLLLAVPLFLLMLRPFGIVTDYAGSGALHFAIFIAFVAIYPSAQIFFGLEARWIALILLAINFLQYAALRAWVPMGVMFVECGLAYVLVRGAGVSNWSFSFPRLRQRQQPQPRKRIPDKHPAPAAREKDVMDEVDPLLEKIAREGISSLTAAERRRLERAREVLLQKEKSHS